MEKIHEDDIQESCLGNTGISNVSSVTFCTFIGLDDSFHTVRFTFLN